MAIYNDDTSQVVQDATSPDLSDDTNQAITAALENSSDDGQTTVTQVLTAEDIPEEADPNTQMVGISNEVLAENPDVIVPMSPVVQITGTEDPDVLEAVRLALDLSSFREIFGDDITPVVVGSNAGENYVIGDLSGGGAASRDDSVDPDAVGVVVDAAGGDDTVDSGAGADSISGGAGNDSISSGAGADSISSGIGMDSIDAGTGVDYASFDSPLGDVEVIVEEDGTVVVRDVTTGELASTQNTDYIELSDGTAIINAADQGDATAGRLVSSTVGDFGYDDYKDAFALEDEKDNIDLVAFADDLLGQTELADLSDADFIEALYQGTFGRSVDPEGLDFYLSALETGDKSRAEVFADLGWSEEGVDQFGLVNEIDGTV